MRLDVEGELALQAGSNDPQVQDGTTELWTPDHFVLGVGYAPTEDWYVEFDVEAQIWGPAERFTVVDEAGAALADVPLEWRESYMYRAGADWYALDDLTVRFGVAYETDPIPDDTLSPLLPDEDRMYAMAGVSYLIPDWHLGIDAAYMRVQFFEREADGSKVPRGTPGAAPGFPGRYQVTADIFSLGLRYTGF